MGEVINNLPLPDLTNDDAIPVILSEDFFLYCGRRLGEDVIPGSDGRCGPDNGPQCPSCSRLQSNAATRLNVLRRLFPRLGGSSKGDALLIGCLRKCGGHLQNTIEFIKKQSSDLIKAVDRKIALSAKPMAPLLPHLSVSEDVANQMNTLVFSLGVTDQIAEYALRISSYNADEAADRILNDLMSIEMRMIEEIEEKESERSAIEQSNAKRREAILEVARGDSDNPDDLPTDLLPNATEFDSLFCSQQSKGSPPKVIVTANCHRMVLVESDTESPCVICSSNVPSVTGGKYKCEFCKICEGCAQSNLDRSSTNPSNGVVHRCPGLRNGGHLHQHQLVFKLNKNECVCDLEGQSKCLGSSIYRSSWNCSICEFDVCGVCIGRPAPLGYDRKLAKVIRRDTGVSNNAASDEGADRGVFTCAASLGKNEDDGNTNEQEESEGLDEDIINNLLPTPRSRKSFDGVRAERQAAALWEGIVPPSSVPPSDQVLLGSGIVGYTENRNEGIERNSRTREVQNLDRSQSLLPCEGKLSSEASRALDLYRFQSDGSLVAAADEAHVENLVRRAHCSGEPTSKAIYDAISSKNVDIASMFLLSQLYAPKYHTGVNKDKKQKIECWCGDIIAPGDAVGCLSGHAMHSACAADLLMGGGSCPSCRKSLFFSKVPSEEVKAAVKFAELEIRRARKEEEERAKNEVNELAKGGVEISFKINDIVLVSSNVALCEREQSADLISGGWHEEMVSACGIEGRVTELVEDGGRTIAVKVRSPGRHHYKEILLVDDYECPTCELDGPSESTTGCHRCFKCNQCVECCRKTVVCPRTTHEWYWTPKLLRLLRRCPGKMMGFVGRAELDDDVAIATAKAERRILRLRGELVAVKKAREDVKTEMDRFMKQAALQKASSSLSDKSVAAIQGMVASGCELPEFQRACHLLLLAEQWGESADAKTRISSLYDLLPDVDSVARSVRRYNAFKIADAARWADAICDTAKYVVGPSTKIDLRCFPSCSAPRTGYILNPLTKFLSKNEVLDGQGRLWLQIVASLDEDLAQGASPLPQGWACVRPLGMGSPAIVTRMSSNLRCFGCGDSLVPAVMGRQKYVKVNSKDIKNGDRLLVAATLEPVEVIDSSKENLILCSFLSANGVMNGSTDEMDVDKLSKSSPRECSTQQGEDSKKPGGQKPGRKTAQEQKLLVNNHGIWYKPEHLVGPSTRSVDMKDGWEEQLLVRGRMMTRRELVLLSDDDKETAKNAWIEARKSCKQANDSGWDTENFASCAKGHLLHPRCFQSALLDGRCCPASGCMEPLFVPHFPKGGHDDSDACCSSNDNNEEAQSNALRAASELSGHADIASKETGERTGEDISSAGVQEPKMCPVCCSGPLVNENCSDMKTHHGQCSFVALRGNTARNRCTPNGAYRVPASEIAAKLTQLSADKTVTELLPRCEKHDVPVMFNGCLDCGHLFTDIDWNDMPQWDPNAKALLEFDKKARTAAQLLAEQVRREAGFLQFERDALAEARKAANAKDVPNGGWGSGEAVCKIIVPPPPPPALVEQVQPNEAAATAYNPPDEAPVESDYDSDGDY